MASVTWRVEELVHLRDEIAAQYVIQNRPTILRVFRAECPIDTGILRQQHAVRPPIKQGTGSYLIKIVAAPYWGVFVHEGHGWIYPVRAKVLRFVTKAGKVVFARKVRPVAPNPWMVRALTKLGLKQVRWKRIGGPGAHL